MSIYGISTGVAALITENSPFVGPSQLPYYTYPVQLEDVPLVLNSDALQVHVYDSVYARTTEIPHSRMQAAPLQTRVHIEQAYIVDTRYTDNKAYRASPIIQSVPGYNVLNQIGQADNASLPGRVSGYVARAGATFGGSCAL